MKIESKRSFALLAMALTGMVVPIPSPAGEVKVGGWMGFTFTSSNAQGQKPGFDPCCWYAYVDASPQPGYRFFGEVEGEHSFKFENEEGEGEFKLERLYFERRWGPAANVRAGKFFLPLGYWYRLHWRFLSETFSRPISIENGYAPKFQVGVQYYGRYFRGNTRLLYYAWISNGPEIFGTDDKTTDNPALGASLFWKHNWRGSRRKTFGFTLAFHHQEDRVEGATEEQDNLVAGAQFRFKTLKGRVEYFRHYRDGDRFIRTWYATGMLKIRPKLALAYRIDWGTDKKHTASADDREATYHSIGLIYRPTANMPLKAEFRIARYRDRTLPDYQELVLFGALKY